MKKSRESHNNAVPCFFIYRYQERRHILILCVHILRRSSAFSFCPMTEVWPVIFKNIEIDIDFLMPICYYLFRKK